MDAGDVQAAFPGPPYRAEGASHVSGILLPGGSGDRDWQFISQSCIGR